MSSKRRKLTWAPIEYSDQPVHPRSVISIFDRRYVLCFFRRKTTTLVRLCGWADWFIPSLNAHANLHLILDNGWVWLYMCGSRGGTGGPDPPLKNHKNIGVLRHAGLDTLKITKLPSRNSMLGHHRHASETPFKWRFAGGPMQLNGVSLVGRWWPAYNGI